MQAILARVEQTTPRSWTFWFRPEQPLRFEAGQYAQLTVPHATVDNLGQTRWMSIASAPGEELIAVLTAFPTSRPSSYKQALKALNIGNTVTFGDPFGDFVLPKNVGVPLVFVAGGIGIAPVLSMVKWLESRGETRDIRLVYSASSPEELAFTEVFGRATLDFVPVVTQPFHSWHGETGRLSLARTLELIGDYTGKLVYLSGPQSLIEPLYNNLVASGVPRAQLVLDYFPGY